MFHLAIVYMHTGAILSIHTTAIFQTLMIRVVHTVNLPERPHPTQVLQRAGYQSAYAQPATVLRTSLWLLFSSSKSVTHYICGRVSKSTTLNVQMISSRRS